jgi:site-specific DNA recombinase
MKQANPRSIIMRQAALYARVSTRRQEQEATIESQLDQLLAQAQQQGYEIGPDLRFVDQAVSGKQLARPGLDRLRDAAATGAFGVLFCLSPDRLARNLGAQQVVLDELRQAGVEVLFLNQPPLGHSPQAKLLLDIQGAFAEYERVLISERMRRGRLYHLRQGQAPPYPAPYGYVYQPANGAQPARWVIHPQQAEVVEQAFVWYTEAQLTVHQLAHRLNERQFAAPAGAVWYASTVGRLLRQPAYKGTAYYNRSQTDDSSPGQPRRQGQGCLRFPRRTPRPAEDWIAVSVPPLVEVEVWQLTQERLEMQTHFAQRNSQHTYLLRGLLVCGTCGHTLQGRTQGAVVSYVCAHGGKQRPSEVPAHTCTVRGAVVEPLIWQALADLLREPQRIQAAWTALQTAPTAASELQRWQQRQKTLTQQRQRLLDAYQAGALTLEELTQRQNPLQVELRELQKHLAAATQPPPLQLSLDTFTQRLERALTAADVETQQEVLRLLIERIVVTDEALTVQHIIPAVNHSRLYPVHSGTRWRRTGS